MICDMKERAYKPHERKRSDELHQAQNNSVKSEVILAMVHVRGLGRNGGLWRILKEHKEEAERKERHKRRDPSRKSVEVEDELRVIYKLEVHSLLLS